MGAAVVEEVVEGGNVDGGEVGALVVVCVGFGGGAGVVGGNVLPGLNVGADVAVGAAVVVGGSGGLVFEGIVKVGKCRAGPGNWKSGDCVTPFENADAELIKLQTAAEPWCPSAQRSGWPQKLKTAVLFSWVSTALR